MTLFRRKLIWAFLVLLVAAGLIERHRVLHQHEELAARSTELARLESSAQRERHRLAQLATDRDAIEREIAAARTAAAQAEAGSVMKLWANRIALLRKLLEEMPFESLPELRLLAPVDWVQVVRAHELDSPEDIRTALAMLRSTARRKMIGKLQEALQAYTAASGGELPAHIEQLAPYLSAPADLEMLQRYALLRSGRLSSEDEDLIRELSTSDLIATLGVKSWRLGNNQAWKPPGHENDTAALARSTAAISGAFDSLDPDEAGQAQLYLGTIQEMFTRFAPQMEKMFGDRVGEVMQGAVKRFGEARNGAVPANLAELAPYFPLADQLLPFARPILAELEYMRDHLGQRSTDPEQLRRYLEKPLAEVKLLRDMKITVNGENVSMDFSFSNKSK
jgi:hypothetical protein